MAPPRRWVIGGGGSFGSKKSLKKEVSACNGSLFKSKKGGKQTRRLSLEHSHDPLTPTFPQCTCVRHLPPVLFLGRPPWAALVEVVVVDTLRWVRLATARVSALKGFVLPLRPYV